MKMTAWVLMLFTLVLLGGQEQASASGIWGEIYTQEGKLYKDLYYSRGATHIYPGNYTIKLLVGNDNIGCSVRVGTKSSNPKLLNISGPLAVRNVTDPLKFFVKIGKNLLGLSQFRGLPFKCGTTGTIRVSNPPNAAVPVMVTLTYGPFLTKTLPMVVTQKMGIKSVLASPARQYYSLNQRVSMTLTPTRKIASRESPPSVYWRVRAGRLCKASPHSDRYASLGSTYTASNEWKYFGSGHDFFREGKPLTKFADLCHRGRTIVEFDLPDEEITSVYQRTSSFSRIKRMVFTVPKQGTPKRRIRPRGIETSPPLIMPDPEPPALPNFELQGEKP